MTYSEVEILEVMVEKKRMQDRLAPFVKKVVSTVDPGTAYKHNWHIDLICEYLEACTYGDIKRLIINIPPRHLKTLIVSVAWPAWLIGRNPSEQILAATYSQSLSMRDSVNCRLVIQSEWYRTLFPKVELTGDMNMKSEFVTTMRGHRIATSVGGTSIGRGAKFIIGDDLINPLQALSDVERVKSNTWVDQNLLTRFNNEKEGCFVGIHQRLHTDDTTGHLLSKGGYEHLSIPLEAEIKEIWDFGSVKHVREKGDVLHPERMGPNEVAQKKVDLGSYGYAGQYQQRPSPLEGGMIELSWFKRYRTPPSNIKEVTHSWDTAQKDKEINDYSAMIKWGETDDGYYILDIYKEKLKYPSLKSKAKGFYDRDRPDVMLIEDKSSGSSLIQDLKEDKDAKYPVKAIEPCGDKVTRLSTCSPTVEAGNVYLPYSASWLVDFENDICNFPNIPKKDVIDAFSQYLNWKKKPALKADIAVFG